MSEFIHFLLTFRERDGSVRKFVLKVRVDSLPTVVWDNPMREHCLDYLQMITPQGALRGRLILVERIDDVFFVESQPTTRCTICKDVFETTDIILEPGQGGSEVSTPYCDSCNTVRKLANNIAENAIAWEPLPTADTGLADLVSCDICGKEIYGFDAIVYKGFGSQYRSCTACARKEGVR